MSIDLLVVLALLVVAVVLFVTEKVSVDVTALLVLGTLLVLGILTPAEGLSGFSNEATVTIGAMFVLSAGLRRSGVLEWVGPGFEALARRSLVAASLALMVVAGVFSAFVNNTAVVAVLLPILLAASRSLDASPSKLLMPLSFAAMFGGVCTLVGTSTNLLVSTIAVGHGMEPFGMFEFSGLGLIFFAVGVAYMLFVGIPLIPERRPPEDLAESYRMGEYLAEVVLGSGSASVGRTVADAPLTRDLDVVVVRVRRADGHQVVANTDTVLEAGDVVLVRFGVDVLERLRRRDGLVLKAREKWMDRDLEAGEGLLVEAVVAPGSSLEGRTLHAVGFPKPLR